MSIVYNAMCLLCVYYVLENVCVFSNNLLCISLETYYAFQ